MSSIIIYNIYEVLLKSTQVVTKSYTLRLIIINEILTDTTSLDRIFYSLNSKQGKRAIAIFLKHHLLQRFYPNISY